MNACFHSRLKSCSILPSAGAQKRQIRGLASSPPRQVTETTGKLTHDQTHQFMEDGFLVLEDFASKEECNAMKDHMDELVNNFDPKEVSFFSTTNQEATTNQYFLDSASKISFFFEEDSFDKDGNLVQDKALSINKCGHALHDLDPVFREFSRSEKMDCIYRSLGFQLPLPVQSMYIFKQPKIGGQVVPHEDSSFLLTKPPSCVGIWLAIDDATVGNGCLHVAKKSHRGRPLKRMTRTNGKVGWPEGRPDYSDLHLEPLETPAGTLVLLHGANVHGSEPNTSDKARHAYSMHVVEGGPGYRWLEDNWLQRPKEMPFKPLFDDVDPA